MRLQTRIAREVRHRDRLEANGRLWRKCPYCDGARKVRRRKHRQPVCNCAVCRGAGGKFVEPQN